MIDLEELLASGKLAEVARGCKTQKELAGKLGLTADAYEIRVRRLRKRGVKFPTLLELLGVAPAAESKPAPQWSNLAAFDAEEAHRMAPDGYHVKGVSTLYGPEGEMLKWVKTARDEQDRLDALLKSFSELAADFKGAADPVPVPRVANEDLLAHYPLGDPHLGMLAWSEETGVSFDLKIAERNLCGAMDQLVDAAPPAHLGIVASLGDFFHSDNTSNRTSRSGNALDVDTRWANVLGVGIRTMRHLITSALTKHERVKVICAIGNHDDHSSVFLSLALSQFYEREPRVEIETKPSKFHWHRFGGNLLGWTHTDTVKLEDLAAIMAYDRPEDWGQTRYRHMYGGHRHHNRLLEMRGCVVEVLPTLAARDAWHHGQGYRAQRDARLHVFKRAGGLQQQHIVNIDDLAPA